ALEGLRLLKDAKVSLVLCDYDMPGMNGVELLRRLRQQRSAEVLMISGQEDSSVAARAQAEGALAFLSKTMSPAVLLRRLGQLLRTASQPPAPSPHHLCQPLLPSPATAVH